MNQSIIIVTIVVVIHLSFCYASFLLPSRSPHNIFNNNPDSNDNNPDSNDNNPDDNDNNPDYNPTQPPCSNDTIPPCAVTPDTYNAVFYGTIALLFDINVENSSPPSRCLYRTYGELDSTNAAAPYNSYYEYDGHLETQDDALLLTMNGIFLTSFVNNGDAIHNNGYYVTGTIDDDGVIIISYCSNNDEVYVGCNSNNCGSQVMANAERVANSLANSKNLVVYPVDFSDCPSIQRRK